MERKNTGEGRGDQGENKCNADRGALLIGLWAHRFRYITGSKKGGKHKKRSGEWTKELVHSNLLNYIVKWWEHDEIKKSF